MTAIAAVGLIASFLILFSLAYRAFRRPDPPRWTRIELISELVCVGLVGLLAVGVTLAVKEVALVATAGLSWQELLAMIAVAVASGALWKLLTRPPAQESTNSTLPPVG